MSQEGAKGRQTWAPSRVRGNSTPVTAWGVRVIVPRTRLIMGGPLTSSTSMISCDPVQCIDDGPTPNEVGDVRKASRPRSVMVKRPPRP